jgi:phage terminase small subunit
VSAASDTTQTVLTERQRRFVDYFADHGNGAKAARQAGYSEESAKQIATENLSKPYLVDAIKRRRKELVEEAGVRPDAVLRMIAQVATFDISEIFDDNGRVKEVSEMSDVARRIVAGIETFTVGTRDGSSHTTTAKIKIPDRLKALELLARHLGLFDDQVTVKGDAVNPFEMIVRQAQGNALVPVSQRDEDDSANDLYDDAPTIDGEVIERSDTPSQNMASDDTLAAFNTIDDSDENENTDAPAVAQTSKQVEDAEPFFRNRRRSKSKLNW